MNPLRLLGRAIRAAREAVLRRMGHTPTAQQLADQLEEHRRSERGQLEQQRWREAGWDGRETPPADDTKPAPPPVRPT